jgi:lysophospholipase L1-like esterase
MVGVAQLVEPRVVISAVVGSSPIVHPIFRVVAVTALLCGPCAAAPAMPVPQLFVAGDSTAAEYKPNPKSQQGWGAVLQPLFDESKLRVVVAARGGRSSRTFITEGHWGRMLADVRPGDFVLIQFGHNDAGALNQEAAGSTRPLRARGTLPGIGDESEKIDNILTGKHETVHSYGWYLRKMIADTRRKGATPILVTLTKTHHWKDGRVPCDAEGYRLWTWQTATHERAAFVDLTRISADRFAREGPAAVMSQFIDDAVHTNLAGAKANAKDVVAGLRSIAGLPLRTMLSPLGREAAADRGPPRDSVCPKL